MPRQNATPQPNLSSLFRTDTCCRATCISTRPELNNSYSASIASRARTLSQQKRSLSDFRLSPQGLHTRAGASNPHTISWPDFRLTNAPIALSDSPSQCLEDTQEYVNCARWQTPADTMRRPDGRHPESHSPAWFPKGFRP